MKRIVIFASGSGSNAENIINFFEHTQTAEITHVLCNNQHAKVFERCKKLHTNCLYFNKEDFYDSETVLNVLKKEADFIILAGFLWRIPQNIIAAFPQKIINIHPALLPKYGGKGMYGMHVHNAVKDNNEIETGITIHYVNENYDEGKIIAQFEIQVDKFETLKSIKKKISQEELLNYPKIISSFLDE